MEERVPRHLGLDIGSRTVGVAVSDPLGLTAQPVEVIRYRRWEEAEERIRQLVREYEVEQVVVGLPRRTDGRYGPEAERIRELAQQLQDRLGISCRLWDERFSTAQAERALLEGDVSRRRRRQLIDQTAAAIVLQAYLDARRRNT